MPSMASSSIRPGKSSSPAGISAQVASATRLIQPCQGSDPCHVRKGLDEPAAVFLDDLAVQLDAAAATEVLDQVPVQRADVRPTDLRVTGADCEVDRACHLLVEQGVSHRPRDPRVAADPELADEARTLVEVEGGDQLGLALLGRRILDPAL